MLLFPFLFWLNRPDEYISFVLNVVVVVFYSFTESCSFIRLTGAFLHTINLPAASSKTKLLRKLARPETTKTCLAGYALYPCALSLRIICVHASQDFFDVEKN